MHFFLDQYQPYQLCAKRPTCFITSPYHIDMDMKCRAPKWHWWWANIERADKPILWPRKSWTFSERSTHTHIHTLYFMYNTDVIRIVPRFFFVECTEYVWMHFPDIVAALCQSFIQCSNNLKNLHVSDGVVLKSNYYIPTNIANGLKKTININ